jgi:hypothetical protein
MKNPFKWRGWFTGRDPREAIRINRLQAITACVRQANAEARKEGPGNNLWSLDRIKVKALALFRTAGWESFTEEEFWREQDEIMGRTINYKEIK